MAFSTSSLTTEAGRSTTSPAAIWLARSSGSFRIRDTPTTSPDRRNQVTIAIDAAAISATTHQNCAASPPGRCGSVTFMPYSPVRTVSGPNSVATTAMSFEACASWIETLARCASRMPVTRSWKIMPSSAMCTSES